MRLVTIGSSSAGNCYLLQGKHETLVIECGINTSQVKKALNFDFSAVVGAVVSHSHNDHSKYVNDFLKNGVPVLGLEHTLSAQKATDSHFAKVVAPGAATNSVSSRSFHSSWSTTFRASGITFTTQRWATCCSLQTPA